MILIRLMGGLGNQMFQYAFAFALAHKNNDVLKLDLSLLNDRSEPYEIATHRELQLTNVFDIEINYATEKDIVYFNGKKYKTIFGRAYNKIGWQFRKHRLIIERERAFNRQYLSLKNNVCLVGSFQSDKYFEEDKGLIRQIYRFKNPILPKSVDLANELKREGTVAIHVRRGDYVTSPVYSEILGALPVSYYLDAINRIKETVLNPHFFIFSDDINWCRQEFGKYNLPLTYVDDEHAGPNAENYLQLMTLCHHFIISNSTFAWWAAWLSSSKDKLVLAPGNWFKKGYPNDIVPENWIKIENK